MIGILWMKRWYFLLVVVWQIESEVSSALAGVSELIFFLLGAMTVVEVSCPALNH